MNHRAVVITGGNLGDVAAALTAARGEIERSVGRIIAASQVYSSPPWGFDAPQEFLNQVLVVETHLEPPELLDAVQRIERELGRRRDVDVAPGGSSRYASRTMDIDILYYDDLVMESERLTIPHPLIARREFVLRPLCEVMPQWRDPRTGLTVEQMFFDLNKNHNFVSNIGEV